MNSIPELHIPGHLVDFFETHIHSNDLNDKLPSLSSFLVKLYTKEASLAKHSNKFYIMFSRILAYRLLLPRNVELKILLSKHCIEKYKILELAILKLK